MKNINRKSIVAVGLTALTTLAIGAGAIALSNAKGNTGLENDTFFCGSYNLTAFAEETATASKITIEGKEVDITSTATFTSTDDTKSYTLCLTVVDTADLKEVTSRLVVGHKIGGTYYNGTEVGLTEYVYSSITFADKQTLTATDLTLGSSFTTPIFIVTEVASTVVDGNAPESVITYAGSEGLAMTANEEGTAYTVSGIGDCTDTDIVIPLTYKGLPVTSIAESAFMGNTAITGITIPDSLTTIGASAFFACYNLETVTIGKNSQLTTISNGAFYYCNLLNSIYIPDSVTTIGNAAFAFSNVNCVYYGGTAEGWAAITIKDNNTPLTSATVYYYSETAPTTEGSYWRYVDGVPTAW